MENLPALEKVFVDVQNGVLSGDPLIVGILVAVFVVLCTIVLISCGGSRKKGSSILMTGLSDAGKTALFGQLAHGKLFNTYTSMDENEEIYKLTDRKKSVRLLDLPGSDRLRSKFVDRNKKTARGLIFVIDSLTFQKDVKDVAEFFYHLLSDPVLHRARVPVLVACNKADQALAKGAAFIRAQLERELNTVRDTLSASLASTDNSERTNVYLGARSKAFSFADLKQKVEFVECSAKSGSEGGASHLDDVREWVSRTA